MKGLFLNRCYLSSVSSSTTRPVSSVSGNAKSALLWGGLLAGSFDLTFAFIFYGLKIGVVQSIAGGLLGRSVAREGGIPTAILGVVLHYVIVTIWAGLFWISSRRLTLLIRHAVPAGLTFGLVVFYGMNSIVLPLSALHTKGWPPSFAPWPIAVHMLLVGLPIALAARKFSRASTST